MASYTRANEIPVSINYQQDRKKPCATDVNVLDRKEGNISRTMAQNWQEGVKLSMWKLMAVRTSYYGTRKSVHNKTVSRVTSFSFSIVIFLLISCIYRDTGLTPVHRYLTIALSKIGYIFALLRRRAIFFVILDGNLLLLRAKLINIFSSSVDVVIVVGI